MDPLPEIERITEGGYRAVCHEREIEVPEVFTLRH